MKSKLFENTVFLFLSFSQKLLSYLYSNGENLDGCASILLPFSRVLAFGAFLEKAIRTLLPFKVMF